LIYEKKLRYSMIIVDQHMIMCMHAIPRRHLAETQSFLSFKKL
jgi:hypothetical protein